MRTAMAPAFGVPETSPGISCQVLSGCGQARHDRAQNFRRHSRRVPQFLRDGQPQFPSVSSPFISGTFVDPVRAPEPALRIDPSSSLRSALSMRMNRFRMQSSKRSPRLREVGAQNGSHGSATNPYLQAVFQNQSAFIGFASWQVVAIQKLGPLLLSSRFARPEAIHNYRATPSG